MIPGRRISPHLRSYSPGLSVNKGQKIRASEKNRKKNPVTGEMR
jgi:hypothetical protein